MLKLFIVVLLSLLIMWVAPCRADGSPDDYPPAPPAAPIFDTVHKDFPPVVLYYRTTCSYCIAGLGYLEGEKIPFVKKDVDADPTFAKEMRRIYSERLPEKKVVVPLILIGDRAISGYWQSEWKKAIIEQMREKNATR